MGNFKVIVAGAGPVGLVAAHALSKANIDFVVLEGRPEVVRDVGASLVLGADSMRLLSQFGMLDKLRSAGTEILKWESYTAQGSKYNGDYIGERARTSFGCYTWAFHRAELIQILYEGLSKGDQARILVNKRLSGIEDTGDGVIVTCADGSTYEGSIVIGADGVHSKTRGAIRAQALKANPDADVDDEVPFPVEYKTMWCTFPRRWEFPPGDHCITHDNTTSLQFINAHNRSWVFCYEKLTSQPTGRVNYTDADMVDYAAKHGEMPIADGRLKLKDVFAQRMSGGMANLEEGVLKHWSGGRIVLAGDACHKFTPNAGLGLNNGIQDVAVLVNELHRLLASAGDGSAPTREELATAFTRYRDARRAAVDKSMDFSRHATRLHAWPNWVYWILNRYVLCNIPGLEGIIWNNVIVPKVSSSYCLDFVDSEEPFQGEVPWKHPMKSLTQAAA